MADREEDSIDLADRIKTNSEYFVVAGVFAALAAYTSRTLPADAGPFEQLSIYSFGTLSILMLAFFYRKLKEDVGNWSTLYWAHFKYENLDLVLFSSMWVISIPGVIVLVPEDGQGLLAFVIIFTLLAVPVLLLATIRYGASLVPYKATHRVLTIFLGSSLLLLVSREIRISLQKEYSIMPITELTLQNPELVAIQFVLIFATLVQSFSGIGILATLVGIPVIMYDKWRGKSPYNQEVSK